MLIVNIIIEVNKFIIVYILWYKKSENLVCNNYLIFFFLLNR